MLRFRRPAGSTCSTKCRGAGGVLSRRVFRGHHAHVSQPHMHATLCGDRAPRRTSGRRLTMRARRACGERPMSCECPWGEGDLVPSPGHAPRRNPCPRVWARLCGSAACGWDDDGTRHRAAHVRCGSPSHFDVSTSRSSPPSHRSPPHARLPPPWCKTSTSGWRSRSPPPPLSGTCCCAIVRARRAAMLPRRRAAQPDGSRP